MARKTRARVPKKQKCHWWNERTNSMCEGSVYHTDIQTGKHFCQPHYQDYFFKGLADDMVQAFTKGKVNTALKEHTTERQAKVLQEPPLTKEDAAGAVEEALAVLEKLENGEELQSRVSESLYKVKSVDSPLAGLKHGGKATFRSIDVDFYCQNFKDDYFALITDKLKRCHAAVNIIMAQLLRVEDEEELVKLVETYGTQMVEGVPIEFSTTTKRHATPFEMKMKMFEVWMKAEKEYRELLKQRSDTLVNALLILSKYGIRFDPKAGQLVVEVLHRRDQQDMSANLLEGGMLSPDESMNKENLLIQSITNELAAQCPTGGLLKAGDKPPTVLDLDVDPNIALFEEAQIETVEVEEEDW